MSTERLPARLARRSAAAGAAVGGAALAYVLVVRGDLTLDLGVGRRIQPLGPIRLSIAAPRATVFDFIADPYLKRTPRAMREKIEVLERGSDMVIAAHYTRLADRLTVTTVESVRFERPERVTFRLLRGPVPHITETYELRETETGTDFEYRGELGTDLWGLGSWWGDQVARPWERTVEESLTLVQQEAERRAVRRGSAARSGSVARSGDPAE